MFLCEFRQHRYVQLVQVPACALGDRDERSERQEIMRGSREEKSIFFTKSDRNTIHLLSAAVTQTSLWNEGLIG